MKSRAAGPIRERRGRRMDDNKQGFGRVAITGRALYQRVDRKLRQDGEMLCTARSERAQKELGRFYIVERGQHVRAKRAVSSGVVRINVNLEVVGRELGVLHPWEQVQESLS